MVMMIKMKGHDGDDNDDDGDDDDDDEGHLLLCLPWDNWTLPDSELGWRNIHYYLKMKIMIF